MIAFYCHRRTQNCAGFPQPSTNHHSSKAAWRKLASITQPSGPSWVARVKEGGTSSHAKVPLSTTSLLIAVQWPLTHAQPSWLSGTILDLPHLKSRVEKNSLNHAAIWAKLGGLGKGGRDLLACPSLALLNPTFDRSLTATNARTTELALWNRPQITTARRQRC